MQSYSNCFLALAAVLSLFSTAAWGWSSVGLSSGTTTRSPIRQGKTVLYSSEESSNDLSLSSTNRRSFVSSCAAAAALVASSAGANDDEEDFGSIAARAAKISKTIEEKEDEKYVTPTPKKSDDPRTAYNFTLPVAGKQVPFVELIHQESSRETGSKVKAVLVVNIKQDDPIARKNIPELIALASKYGRSGEFAVVACPTDQGYYEPDTSALIRLKLASEYGYGINPATIVTDKVNLLGSGAIPFWRWLEGTCRTPAGLGKIQGNFEKFLLDGTTGLPVRRYPRKYQPYDIQNDIEALIAGKKLPPAGSNFREEWRAAAADAERDTYRFQKGLNYFDQ